MAETSGAQESQDSAEQLASSSAPTQVSLATVMWLMVMIGSAITDQIRKYLSSVDPRL